MDRIEDCMRAAKRGEAAWIFLKMNSLVDARMIEALYEASQAGVKVDCLVRGICCLRPGLKGVSEHIHVKSIVGRFLEHQRVFFFSTGEWEKLYLSSADWMPRNLDRRVELMFPVTSPLAIESIKGWMRLQWQDENRAHRLKADGTYRPISREKGALDSQACFIGELMERSRV
jgi:polyphosphate kinase